jgi:hypothetical protein
MKPHLVPALDASEGVEESWFVDAGVGERSARRESRTPLRRSDPLQFLKHEPRDRQAGVGPRPVPHVARSASLPAGWSLAQPDVDRYHDGNTFESRRVRPAGPALYGNLAESDTALNGLRAWATARHSVRQAIFQPETP